MSDLERHRIARRFNGFPIYDEDQIVDFINEPEWTWDALTGDQQATIRSEAMRLQRGRDLSWDDAYSYILGDYGIRCPHSWQQPDIAWRECRWCHCAEQLPGRIVTVAGSRMRVSDPPPPVLRIPVPMKPTVLLEAETPGMTLTIDEYEWTGSSYRRAH